MRHPLSFLCLFVLIVSAPIAAFVVPWAASDSNPLSATQRHQPSDQQSTRLRNVFPQLTWLRDTAIEKVFGLPPKTAKVGPDKPSSLSKPTSSQLPATLLAKYGGDVVLRFNLSTPEEEHALAEAADTLFLDVWEFTNNWADIRLREDDASFFNIGCSEIHILIVILGSCSPRLTAQIAPKRILQLDARSSKDDLSVLPFNYIRGTCISPKPPGSRLYTSLEELGRGR
jgi:hypothetical protein